MEIIIFDTNSDVQLPEGFCFYTNIYMYSRKKKNAVYIY